MVELVLNSYNEKQDATKISEIPNLEHTVFDN